ncbi:hypothetical protein E2C01_096078 [Portunus trituberculatus]|uniref:Uncharacterized protein n=1 Tax=Portunus trituberculatus TaxID=210409 RepID=A0A5B7K132_PORTR|nr:hypothetical protein [Portunus trituberculatus]
MKANRVHTEVWSVDRLGESCGFRWDAAPRHNEKISCSPSPATKSTLARHAALEGVGKVTDKQRQTDRQTDTELPLSLPPSFTH